MSEAADTALLIELVGDESKLLRSLEASVAKFDKASSDVEGRGRKFAKNVEDAFASPNIGKALERTFSSARLGVLDEGSARLRIFGSALEPLGGIGLAAAGGVAAFAFAMERTEKAVDYAANIEKLSETVGVSTDFIQKFNFAAHQNEIEVGQADESLKKLNTTLGLVQSGLARKQQVNAFASIGLTPDQLRQFKDAGELFPVLAQKIAAVGNASEEAAIAKRLGIEDLLPLLKQGADGFDALARKAEDLGIVMDAGTIEKAADAKKKLTELDDVMKAKSNVTFAQFADTLVLVKQGFLDAETAVLGFLAALTGTTTAEVRLQRLRDQVEHLKASGEDKTPVGAGLIATDTKQINDLEIQAINEKLKAADKAPPPTAAARQLVAGGAAKGSHDATLGFDKSAQDAYAAGLKALIQAQAALLVDVQQRATAEKAAIFHDLSSKIADLDVEEAKIRAAKNDSHKASQIALVETAKADQINAAHAKAEEIDRQTAEAVRQQALAYQTQDLDGQAQLLQLAQGLTFSEELRQKYALQLVDLAYQRTQAELQGVIFSQTASDADKALALLKLKQLEEQRGLTREQARRGGSGPAQQASSIIAGVKQQSNAAADHAAVLAEIERQRQGDLAHEKDYVQAKLQADAQYNAARLQQASDLFGNLATLSGSSNRTLAAIGKAAAITQATIDGIVAVQKALASAPPPFNFALAASVGVAAAVNVAKIAGLKDGGWVDGPGGPTDDSVLRRLSRTEFVVNSRGAARNGPLLEAINAGHDVSRLLPQPSLATVAAPPAAASGGGDVHLHYAPSLQYNEPDVVRAIDRQGREFRAYLKNLRRNGDI